MHLQLRIMAFFALLTTAAGAVTAQTFPNRPVRMVIGFPASGPIDLVARVIAPHLFEGSGQQVVIDNRAGANGIIGTDIVAKATPDGHTVYFGTAGALSVNPTLYPRLPFDIHRDFIPLTQVSSVSSLLYIHASIPARTLPEFIAHAKAHPGKVNFSSSGSGGLPHLAGELLNVMAGVRTVHIPYKGTAPAFTALLGGEVQYMFSAVASGLPHIKAGKLRAIAATTRKRVALLPDVPTVAETLPGFEVDNWYGLVLPARTPAAVVNQFHAEVVRVLKMPDIDQKLVARGTVSVGSSPSEFAAFMKAEIAKWARVIKEASVRPE